ncbi:cytochrome b/b6 domain-containing protein [Vibrio sp. Of7-15]|uniref:cytochrome b/b6 domain-containing protein n=1 Tax=Vibrio sp. Of7-15 TaxID=2724879 RepID=UPI001EF35093|nr:cytochrome b/b6 domain-containing protein [Vibrio sp. Of7-15]MCG7498236.1 cytochrome b/b6 domain-containing protein [Vibrio sp. Of7-15]
MKVWDLPTRLYHWLQALFCTVLLVSGFSGNGPHELIGIALFMLLLWRLSWGIIGSDTSRFSQFLASPASVWRYLKGKRKTTVGHNPAGGWMIITMLLCLFTQCLTGFILMGVFDAWLSDNSFILENTALIGLLHGLGARLLLLLIGFHLFAILFYKFKRIPLVKAMFTGKQPHQQGITEPKFKQKRLAFSCLLACVGGVFTLLKASGVA